MQEMMMKKINNPEGLEKLINEINLAQEEENKESIENEKK